MPIEPGNSDPSENQFVHGSGRHLVLVPCTDVEIMPYCIQLLLTCFKVSFWKSIQYLLEVKHSSKQVE